MIDVLKIRGLDQDNLIGLLAKEGPMYKVKIPRSGQLSESHNDKAFDYLRAAYVGQELYEVSEDFSYDPLEPDEMGDIVFELKCHDIKALADKLIGISFLFGQFNPAEDHNIAMVINTLSDRMREERLVPACGHFIEYYIDLTV